MSDFGEWLPSITAEPPGPRSLALADRLAAVETRNVTWLGDDFPVFWTEASGANIRDADDNVYIDLTAAFGVALWGHRNPWIGGAIQAQAERLVHGMGDVHPPRGKLQLLESLARLMPWADTRTTLANSGSEAVEIALKTARLKTGKSGVIAFEGGYHGLTAGALAATERPYFREPFQSTLNPGVAWLPYPHQHGDAGVEPVDEMAVLDEVRRLLREGVRSRANDHIPVGAIILEAVQARGGVRVLSESFGRALTALANEAGVVLIADEIFTGVGRCGALLASSRVGLTPDVVCVGKVLGGGLPLSACCGSAEVMNAWPESPGEALHTSTFLGHPLACSAGTAVLAEVDAGLPERAEALGEKLRAMLGAALGREPGVSPVRGLGLLLGFTMIDGAGAAIPGAGFDVAKAALRRGLILLPAGDRGEVVELSPPVVLKDAQIEFAVDALVESVREVVGGAAREMAGGLAQEAMVGSIAASDSDLDPGVEDVSPAPSIDAGADVGTSEVVGGQG